MAKKNEQETEDLLPNGFDAQAMIEKNAKKRTIVRYADRVKLEVVKETRHYKLGDVINPHRVMAEALIDQGIAEPYKVKEATE